MSAFWSARSRDPRRAFRPRALVALGLLAVVLPTAIGIWSTREARRALLSKIRESRISLARAVAEEIHHALDTGVALIRTAARRPGLISYLERGERDLATAVLQNVHETAPLFRSVAAADLTGRILASFPLPPAESSLGAPLGGVSVHIADGETVAVLREPVRGSSGQLIAYLIGEISLKKAGHAIEDLRIGQTGDVTVADREGRVLLSSDPRREGRTLAAEVQDLIRQGEGMREYFSPLAQRQEIATIAPVKGYPWLVVVSQAEAEAFSPLSEFVRGVAWGFAALVLLGVLVALMVYRDFDRYERRLRADREKTRLIVDTAHDAFVAIDDEGRVTDWNRKAETTFGWSRDEAIGHPLADLIIPARYREAHRQGLQHFRATGEGPILNRNIEIAALRRDGQEFPVELAVSPLRLGQRHVFNAFVRDITERKNAAEALQRQAAALAASNEELEAFSYSVSHDLRAPLRAIDGFSQALQEDCAEGLDAAGKDHLRRIRGSAARMAQLIDDLLELSRVTRSGMRQEAVDLSALAQEVADALQKSDARRKAEFAIAPGLTASADRRLLRVALENLLGNAWKFTARKERARIEFGADRRDGAIVFYVADNGAGFDMRYADKLFGVFQRLHTAEEFDGTGVGLATVKRIVQRHGGRIWAEAEVDRGATFFFTL